MAHFAKLDEQNIVKEVIVVNNDVLNTDQEETSGIKFLIEWSNGYTNWKQTSFNAKINGFRKNYAAIGYAFDSVRDAFIPPKPYPSWILNEDTCLWDAPVPKPENNDVLIWDENLLNWVAVP